MNVHVAYRPKDRVILGVFSSQENAEKYQSRCSGLDQDVEISNHELDKEAKDSAVLEDADHLEAQCRSGWIG